MNEDWIILSAMYLSICESELLCQPCRFLRSLDYTLPRLHQNPGGFDLLIVSCLTG